MLARFRRRRANKQEGDVHALDRDDDQRGGVQGDAYRSADPRATVEEERVTMSGPGGAPQEGKSVDQRRSESEEWREGRGSGSS
jgi:hypothetical protein